MSFYLNRSLVILSILAAALPSTILAQTVSETRGFVPNEVIVTLDRPYRRLMRATQRPLHPELCNLRRQSVESDSIQHLKFLKRAFESEASIDDTRSDFLANYLGDKENFSFCNRVIIKAHGKDPEKFASNLVGRKLLGGFKVLAAQPNYRYFVAENDAKRAVSSSERPKARIAVITTQELASTLAGRRWVNEGEMPNNLRDDDLNGYRDDQFGILKGVQQEQLPGESGQGGFISLGLAKNAAAGITYTTESAAKGLLYALHNGASDVFLPFDINDAVLVELAGKLSQVGGGLILDSQMMKPRVANATAQGTGTIVVSLKLPGKFLGHAIAQISDTEYYAGALSGTDSNFAVINKVPLNVKAKVMIAIDGVAATAGGKAEYEVTLRNSDPHYVNFTGKNQPNMRKRITYKAQTLNSQPLPGRQFYLVNQSAMYKRFPSEPTNWESFTNSAGETSYTPLVGSFYITKVSNGVSPSVPTVYGVAVADRTHVARFASLSVPNTIMCFTVIDSKRNPLKDGSLTIYLSKGAFDNEPLGDDGKNCFIGLPKGEQYELKYSKGSITKGGTGTVSATPIVVTVGTGGSVATPTPTPTPTKTPTGVARVESLSGSVVTAANVGVSGVIVVLVRDSDRKSIKSTLTNSLGKFLFTNIPVTPGQAKHTVHFAAARYNVIPRTVAVDFDLAGTSQTLSTVTAVQR